MTGTITFYLPGRPPRTHDYKSRAGRWELIKYYRDLREEPFEIVIRPHMNSIKELDDYNIVSPDQRN